MQNSKAVFAFFCFRSEMPFLGKFDPKGQNYQFKLKFDAYTNSNMQNSMVVFTFLVFDRKCSFWVNLVQKVRIISLSWNLVPTLIRISRIQWWCLLSGFDQEYPFWANLVQKIKIVSLRWDFILKLIQICTIQGWYSILSFSTENTFFGTIWSKKIKIVSLRWNLIPRLILICRTQWRCSLFLISIRNVFFGQI